MNEDRLISSPQPGSPPGARVGVDFGGTKIEAAALHGSGAIMARSRRANPGGYDEALACVRDLVGLVSAGLVVHSIGLGIPGSVSPRTGLIRNANSTWLNGRDLPRDLERTLGVPVRLANDANCFALSEAIDGAGAGARVVFGVILGTGCGGGLTVDGRIVEGASGIGGEWGHAPLPWAEASEHPGPPCWCGRRGCMETFVSGPAFERDYAQGQRDRLPAQAIVARARDGEPAAAATLDRYVDRLGRGLAMVCDVVDPDVIVLGGGLSNVDELYDRLPPVVARHVFSDVFATRILRALHGDSSGVRGAAWL